MLHTTVSDYTLTKRQC